MTDTTSNNKSAVPGAAPRVAEVAGLTLFLTSLLILWFQTHWAPIHEPQLVGVKPPSRTPPHFTIRGWMSGEFQKAYGTWFDQCVGFRGFWIRTDNQINFSLFHEITPSKATKTVLGQDQWLYEKAYIGYFLNASPTAAVDQERFVRRIKEFQAQCDANGKPFLMVISPSKAEIYPEHLPESVLKLKAAYPRKPAYEQLRTFLKQEGIRYIDGPEIFTKLKADSPSYPLFPRGGIHWNLYGAFEVVKEIHRVLNPLLQRKMPLPVCTAVRMEKPRGTDIDLGELINIWTPEVTEAPTPYPQFDSKPAATPVPIPQILIAGDSFSFQLANLMTQQGMCAKIQVSFYNRRLVTYPGESSRPLDPNKTDWKKILAGKDAVILQVNQTFLGPRGFEIATAAFDSIEQGL